MCQNCKHNPCEDWCPNIRLTPEQFSLMTQVADKLDSYSCCLVDDELCLLSSID